MRIRRCLLDAANPVRVEGRAIGRRIQALGKECLWNRRSADTYDVVVVHYISALHRRCDRPFDTGAILAILCELGLSAHYLTGRRGGVLQLVPPECRAWHAGGSIMPGRDGRRNVNDFSIGIELVATHDSGFTPSQYRRLGELCHHLWRGSQRGLRIVGHEHVAGAAAVALGLRRDCKVDPGPRFDWERLCRELGNHARTADPGIILGM